MKQNQLLCSYPCQKVQNDWRKISMKKMITVLALLMVCNLGTGCSQKAEVETEPASITVPLSESTEPSKEVR